MLAISKLIPSSSVIQSHTVYESNFGTEIIK